VFHIDLDRVGWATGLLDRLPRPEQEQTTDSGVIAALRAWKEGRNF
jgi:hypothetical protein